VSAWAPLSRLNRNRKTAQHRLPNAWPLDHVDITEGDRRPEQATGRHGNGEVAGCEYWPACGCTGDCDEAAAKTLPRWAWIAWFALLALCILAAWLASNPST